MTHTLTTKVPVVERVIFLRKVPLFEALPPHELEPIAAVAGRRSSRKASCLRPETSPATRSTSLSTAKWRCWAPKNKYSLFVAQATSSARWR